MSSAAAPTAAPKPAYSSASAQREAAPSTIRQRFPLASIGLTLLFLALAFFPPVSQNPRLIFAFTTVTAALLAWQTVLTVRARRAGRTFVTELTRPIASHYVQALVQFSIFLYWGWYWPKMYQETPLIIAQLIFLYALTALLSWSRGRAWRPGFGPMPIILSTSFFMWFKDDWFVFQFVLVALGAFGKEFITWQRDGRTRHIFNPSSFGLTVVSLVLIFTGATNYTWAPELATTIGYAPHMYILIFLGGLLVQYLFSVTLITLSAMGMLVLLNLIYTQTTGVYQFVNTNIPPAVFLGLFLLVTDPATSPRTNLGRIIFGALYGAADFVLFDTLGAYGAPELFNKLLPVPFLNLCVPFIDRVTARGALGSINNAWERAWPAPRLNLAHMSIGVGLFGGMYLTGFIAGRHPGDSISFWKQALAEGKPQAARKLLMTANALAQGRNDPAAWNELGVMYMTGQSVAPDPETAALCFSKACESGDLNGCSNVAQQLVFLRRARSEQDVSRAMQRLEHEARNGVDGKARFLLGAAYERGRGRPRDLVRAAQLYELCGVDNLYAAKGIARIVVSQNALNADLSQAAHTLQRAARGGDAESAWYLAHMLHHGIGVPRNQRLADEMLQLACRRGLKQACEAAATGAWQPYADPNPMLAPPWSTAFPLRTMH